MKTFSVDMSDKNGAETEKALLIVNGDKLGTIKDTYNLLYSFEQLYNYFYYTTIHKEEAHKNCPLSSPNSCFCSSYDYRCFHDKCLLLNEFYDNSPPYKHQLLIKSVNFNSPGNWILEGIKIVMEPLVKLLTTDKIDKEHKRVKLDIDKMELLKAKTDYLLKLADDGVYSKDEVYTLIREGFVNDLVTVDIAFARSQITKIEMQVQTGENEPENAEDVKEDETETGEEIEGKELLPV
jgi:hypothetical protein